MSTPKLPNIPNHMRTPTKGSQDPGSKPQSQITLPNNKKDSRPPSHIGGHASPRRMLIEDNNFKTFTNTMMSERAGARPDNTNYQPMIRHQKNDSLATTTTTTTERQFIDSKMYTLSEFAFMNVKDMKIETELEFEDLGRITMHRSTRSYTDNLKLLNDIEMRRIPFTRKNYMTKEQIELNKRINERFVNQEKGLESVKGKNFCVF
jgi:hypothetical protein